ncbi:4-alpha-glucanotransferase [Rodentibacter mrazii]|uniref:4-alpha-glucanotransferase n=1 Tax=Rodentibacter mrazii TaxID=1908257 RepID=A0A1V3IJQ6_9PAST|nr:4-alpha-glucanotransferase [Rodentibacter mrazii]OOF41205.1 4-alpha-glucanotransferase [Rodentibacter mrazii]
MELELLQKTAQELGIAPAHYDIDGRLIYADPKTLSHFVELLKPVENKCRREEFDDVLACFENEPIHYDVERIALTEPIISLELLDENSISITQKITQNSTVLSLPPLSFGYYQLLLSTKSHCYSIRLLVSPKRAFQPPVLKHKKIWGINVQIYSLRSQSNWGIGDFGDLAYLIEQSAKQGADYVGINPLHLSYPAVPEWANPYSSSSRRWLNFLYLNIPNLPEFKRCKSLQSWFKSEATQTQILTLHNSETVNYSEVYQLKLTALEQLFAFFNRSKSVEIIKRRQLFEQYVKSKGEALQLQGLFNVLDAQEHADHQAKENTIGWLGWRKECQHLGATKRRTLLKTYHKQIGFFAWLQWLMEQQLAELQKLCKKCGMQLGIYGDLAVNSSRGSVDVWSDPELYCVNISIGAPPDPLGPVGQNWNLPPYNPSVLKARGFAPFIEMLQANMQYFGVLRIDHVMGLFRLWWIPEGKTAQEGAYVHYPFDELMAILAIESVRHQCLIIGEDLGTVPDEVRSKLNELQIFSYFVLYFAQRDMQFPHCSAYPKNAYAAIGTHDVPSLQSFWHCRDLELFDQLNILRGEALKQKYDQRMIDKQALINSLRRDHYLPPNYEGDALSMAMHDNLNFVIHRYLAESESKLIGVQLENLLSQEVVFNLPGTLDEYPNWRKKLAQPLEFIFNNESLQIFFAMLNEARKV